MLSIADLKDAQFNYKSAIFLVDDDSQYQNKHNVNTVEWEPSTQAKGYYEKVDLKVSFGNGIYSLVPPTQSQNCYRLVFISKRVGKERMVIGVFIRKNINNMRDTWLMEKIVNLNVPINNALIKIPGGAYTAIYIDKRTIASF